MDSINETALYAVATESLVSQTSGVNTWVKMVEATKGITPVLFFDALADTESQFKEDFTLTRMPNAWNSAKSIVKTALKLGIPLFSENGEPKGKTAVQDAIKATKIPDGPFEKAMRAANVIRQVINECSSIEKALVLSAMGEISAD